ncbi:MAG: host attachment protein [Parasphingorhabdus sp.]|nr:host attachment protein [Parasphingorhabdus sp.]
MFRIQNSRRNPLQGKQRLRGERAMLVDNGTLVMALDGANMLIYRNIGAALNCQLELIREKQQYVAATADLGADRPGRTFSSQGRRRSSYASSDLHQKSEEQFIRECLSQLEQLACEKTLPVIIIAPPTALGIARSSYSVKLAQLIAAEIDRDYTQRSATETARLLIQTETGTSAPAGT